jgi:carbamate kinase
VSAPATSGVDSTDDTPSPVTLVIALGGNAILRRGDDGSIETQLTRSDAAMQHIARLVGHGKRVALTHGNGPVVGNIVLRNEAARDTVTPMPLYIAGADSEGGIGFMLQLSLANALWMQGIRDPVATIITETVVDPFDPAFEHPTKPIGPYYTTEQMRSITDAEPGWSCVEVPGCGWRRVVASPRPLRVVQSPVVARLLANGMVAIAAGGGGVPVVEAPDGQLHGIDAVIDKDWASAMLAFEIGADALVILMESDRLYLDWGGADQRAVDRLTVDEADELISSGVLDRGSILPKVAASAWFARRTGRGAVICRTEDLDAALDGHAGTHIG